MVHTYARMDTYGHVYIICIWKMLRHLQACMHTYGHVYIICVFKMFRHLQAFAAAAQWETDPKRIRAGIIYRHCHSDVSRTLSGLIN